MRDGAGSVMTVDVYRALATLHRPKDPELIAGEVRRMHATGLSARDISTHLGMALDAVQNIIHSTRY